MKIEAWGWSDQSPEEAQQRARARAQTALARTPLEQLPDSGARKRGSYYGGDLPFREAILEEVSQGAVPVVITRNTLGCDVLNVDGAAFADLDYEPPRRSGWAALFDFGGKKAAAARAAWDESALARLREGSQANRGWGLRVYRTAGGYRVLATSQLLPAGSSQADRWLEDLGSDPLYRKLCERQKSFRARLTPKPWRCGSRQPRFRFPFETEKARQGMDRWLADYQQKTAGFAVCELVETLGVEAILPDLRKLVELHDTRTRVGSRLPLA